MRIYAAADIHNHEDRFDEISLNINYFRPDLFIAPGDLTSFLRPAAALVRLRANAVPILGIRGNSDTSRLSRLMDAMDGVRNLHLKTFRQGGFSFTGLGGTIPLPFYSMICLNENALLKRAKRVIRRESILITHTPPRGVLDKAGGRFSVGSRGLREFILEKQPLMNICGHVHEAAGVEYLGKTLVINCAMSRQSAGAIINLEAGEKPQVEIIPR